MHLPAELEKCVEFHGHLCPGLVIGYRAAVAAREALSMQRAADEEIIAIVENNSCATDAVQVITGCTFGKGNLFFRDYGKMVFTLAVRPTGRAVRVSVRGGSKQKNKPTENNVAERVQWLLKTPLEQIFNVQHVTVDLPDEAQIQQSVPCDRCGEPVMVSRTRKRGAQALCIPCAKVVK